MYQDENIELITYWAKTLGSENFFAELERVLKAFKQWADYRGIEGFDGIEEFYDYEEFKENPLGVTGFTLAIGYLRAKWGIYKDPELLDEFFRNPHHHSTSSFRERLEAIKTRVEFDNESLAHKGLMLIPFRILEVLEVPQEEIKKEVEIARLSLKGEGA